MSTRTSQLHIVDGITSVDCQNQVRSWSLLRSIMWFIIPSCTGNISEKQLENRRKGEYYNNNKYLHYLQPPRSRSVSYSKNTKTDKTSGIKNMSTGTIFGYRQGKVTFCIQSKPDSDIPTLLLELALPTAILAKEMKSGLLRIALECNNNTSRHSSSNLLSVPIWSMYCNGRKVGSAIKCVPTQADKRVLRLMQSIDEGVGIINQKTLMNSLGDNDDDPRNNLGDLMYLRANFERVSASSNSESFHLINQDGSNNQQLSIFFTRTR
ncbi:protein MIZU-KUSSEI 1-like [Papaver somniferum]|uniref:protein MIZU-KUSSEI 1-like n=1 Tax=Papaver somniferum TaxID=3469 RepID=UPI000E7001A7|nr:protein MIZU-KUSSEI 1-like [Papaver somniferum]